ncbi:MAG: hypothetical protein MHMPM18_000954 [Marteilia pararefringens]
MDDHSDLYDESLGKSASNYLDIIEEFDKLKIESERKSLNIVLLESVLEKRKNEAEMMKQVLEDKEKIIFNLRDRISKLESKREPSDYFFRFIGHNKTNSHYNLIKDIRCLKVLNGSDGGNDSKYSINKFDNDYEFQNITLKEIQKNPNIFQRRIMIKQSRMKNK